MEAVFDDHRLRDLTETPLEVIKKAPGHLLSALKETDVYFVVGIEPKNRNDSRVFQKSEADQRPLCPVSRKKENRNRISHTGTGEPWLAINVIQSYPLIL